MFSVTTDNDDETHFFYTFCNDRNAHLKSATILLSYKTCTQPSALLSLHEPSEHYPLHRNMIKNSILLENVTYTRVALS